MSAIAAPAGSPGALDSDVDALARTARALSEAADLLRSIAVESHSQAVDELRTEMSKGREGLVSAESRYTGTVAALRDYAVELRDFHDSAHRAMDAEHEALLHHSQAEYELDYAAEQLRYAAMNPDDVATRETWERELHVARMRLHQADATVDEARARYASASDALDAAARRAVSRIQAATEATDDDYLDHLGNVLSRVGEVISTIAEWAEKYFSTVIEAVTDIVKVIAFAAAAVLVLVAIAAVALVAAVALLPQLLFSLDAYVEILIRILMPALAAGFSALGALGGLLGFDQAEMLRLVVLALGIIVPAAGAFILWRLSVEAREGAEWMERLRRGEDIVGMVDPDDVKAGPARDAVEHLVDPHETVDSADDLLRRAGWVDAAGNQGADGEADRSVVEVTKVVVDGETRWIVTLPSTTDWVFGGDLGSLSDFDVDVLLMTHPELASKYEAAVLDAMEHSGVGPGEPVLLAGWSLGGIMAGHLASSGAGGYDYAGIIAAGSPIDHMDTHGIPVLQVKHELDPVHQLDLIDVPSSEPGRVEVWDGGRSGIGLETKVSPAIGVPHDNGMYAATLEEHLRRDDTLDDQFEDWFYGPGDNVEHHLYSVSE